MRRIGVLMICLMMMALFPLSVIAGEEVTENNTETAAIIEPLCIDSMGLYEGMEQTYAQGYVPWVTDGKAVIILPLVGQTYNGKVTVTADLGAAEGNPFVLGNYSQTATDFCGTYVFRFELSLTKDRVNGAYPVTMRADYLDARGNAAWQSFLVYVTITDGVDLAAQNASASAAQEKETVDKPRLYISSCETDAGLIGGEDDFTVTVTVENIGTIRARQVLLTYGSDTVGIVPGETNNLVHLDNIAGGKSQSASFVFRTTRDVPAGEQSFFVKLDYEDLYGGIYTETRTFLVQVMRPAEMEFDPVSIPKEVVSGETFSIPVNVFNTGKSMLRNVSAQITAPGLVPTSSVFFGSIPPGEQGNGEMKVYAGILSMAEGYTQDYGRSNGIFTITYTDDNGEVHREEMEFYTEILRPETEEDDSGEGQNTVGQWWFSVLAAFAVIAILVSVIVTTNTTRLLRIGAKR